MGAGDGDRRDVLRDRKPGDRGPHADQCECLCGGNRNAHCGDHHADAGSLDNGYLHVDLMAVGPIRLGDCHDGRHNSQRVRRFLLPRRSGRAGFCQSMRVCRYARRGAMGNIDLWGSPLDMGLGVPCGHDHCAFTGKTPG